MQAPPPTDSAPALRHWLALARAPGLGPRGARKLLLQFGSPDRLFEPGQARELEPRIGRMLQQVDQDAVTRDLDWLQQPDCHLLTLGSADYPPLLDTMSDAPPVLFVRGDPGLLSRHQLAVVGSRNPTAGGVSNAREFSRFLAGNGLVITSGLASGIDTAAHLGALDAGAATVAVMGTGPDRVYPAANRELAHRIAGCGALVSEFPPGTPPAGDHFPRRNRIISGLSLGTLVVEATLRSGSLITARHATEQGREVFAIPGSIHNPMARGCHRLIREGAKLVETAEHILEELGALALAGLQAGEATTDDAPQDTPPRELDEEYQRLLECMGYDPRSIDELVDASGLTAHVVSSMLLILELQGCVAPQAGGRYSRIE